jgi:hypothetical protein
LIQGALVSFTDAGAGDLPPGTTSTILGNTWATPMGGAFANLADGELVNINGSQFNGDYQGGDGNDLILTVVP